jgi:hypothetical protein
MVGKVLTDALVGGDELSDAERDTDNTDFPACSAATPIARTVVCSARSRTAAECCWKTNWRCASPMPMR